jgi:hypothetical protein
VKSKNGTKLSFPETPIEVVNDSRQLHPNWQLNAFYRDGEENLLCRPHATGKVAYSVTISLLLRGHMKLSNDFKSFLSDTVNLNQYRITQLEDRVETIKSFLRTSDWEPKISKFIEQGSWSHDTIIRPVDGGEFDADLLVKIKQVDGWSAAQYVKELGRVFRDSSRYSDMTQVYDYCVTITYADDCTIDIAPLVMEREYQGKLEVCDRRNDKFEESQPIEYTRWIREKNGYSGNNSFRKATRLIKYIRDIKKRFSCQSILLTTLIGDRIEWFDKDSNAFADTPSALQTLMGRLDDWLQARPEKPVVQNPALTSEDFADLWNDTQYSNFRNFVNKYRRWIDEAIAAQTRSESIEKWRMVFGDEFAKGEAVKKAEVSAMQQARALLKDSAAHLDSLVDTVIDFGITVLPLNFRTPLHGVVAWSMKRLERALPETDFRRCVRIWGGQVQSSG